MDDDDQTRQAIAAYSGPITHCPPGTALGAGDLHLWAQRRGIGQAGIPGQRDKDLKAWARNPASVGKYGQISKRRQNAARKTARKIARIAAKRARNWPPPWPPSATPSHQTPPWIEESTDCHEYGPGSVLADPAEKPHPAPAD